MESFRLPRFQRTSTVAPTKLTERDHEIIRYVHRHRFMRSSHITALIDGSSQQLLRRLKLLYHHGFLERPRAQLEYYHQGGTRPMVYGLGSKGGALLKQELGLSLHQSRWSEKNRSIARIFLEHALLVSDVMVAIELASRKNGQVRLLTNEKLSPPKGVGKHQPFNWKVKINNQLKLGVIPDWVFALEISDGSRKAERSYFFLEADRGTMPVARKNLSQTSFYRKLLAYQATWSQGLHHSLFGFHRFRVLTVTTSPGRVDSLVEACSQLKSGHGLFLFADLASFQKGDIFTLHWKTGKKGETNFLMDGMDGQTTSTLLGHSSPSCDKQGEQ
jgi:hypothetical protein